MQRFNNILYIASPDSACTSGLERAVNLALNNQARLTVVEAINENAVIAFSDQDTFPIKDFRATILDEHKRQLDQMVESWDGQLEIQTEVLIGIPSIEIIRKVLRDGHDIVVKTAVAGTSFERVFGSEDMSLLRKCPCPVWLFKPNSQKKFERILAAVDVDDAYSPEELPKRQALNEQVLELAMSLAISDSSELHIATAWRAVGESYMRGRARIPEDEVAEYVSGQRQKYKQCLDALVDQFEAESLAYVQPQLQLLKGSPRKEIPVFVEKNNIDLVVMGTVARTGIPGFVVGNTAETILSQIDCSVLAIKPQGFETPVKL